MHPSSPLLGLPLSMPLEPSLGLLPHKAQPTLLLLLLLLLLVLLALLLPQLRQLLVMQLLLARLELVWSGLS